MGKELHDCIAVGKEHGQPCAKGYRYRYIAAGRGLLPWAEGFCRTGKQKAIALDKKMKLLNDFQAGQLKKIQASATHKPPRACPC